jgi:hypothetical protein
LVSNHFVGKLLRKEYSYTSTIFLGNCGLFYAKSYILTGRKFRPSLLPNILYRTAVVFIVVVNAGSARGRLREGSFLGTLKDL